MSGPALIVRGPDDVAIEERVLGRPWPGEVLIEPYHVGVCGTDLEIIRGALDPAYVRYPLVLGHEWSGRVLAVGDARARAAGRHARAGVALYLAGGLHADPGMARRLRGR